MHALASRVLTEALMRSKRFLKTNRTTRRILQDVVSRESFTSTIEHEVMLADVVRMDSYAEAIRRHIRPGDVVVDLGAGTGILSLLAAAQRPGNIYAIDHSEFLELARRIARHNNVEGIQFIRTHSRDFDPAEPVDVILHEQMGNNLLDEHMLDSILDLKRRVLAPGGRILPARFELFIEPVSLRPPYRIPYLWEQRIHGIDFGVLRDDPELAEFTRGGHQQRTLEADVVSHLLGEPEPILRFDLSELTDASELHPQTQVTRTVTSPGTLDGFAVYFRVIFDDDLSFDTSPVESLTHWSNQLFRVPLRQCESGEQLSYTLAMPNLADAASWSVTLAARVATLEPVAAGR